MSNVPWMWPQPAVTTALCYAQNTITFHLDFGPEILEGARHDALTMYSIEHLRHANAALGRLPE